MKRINIISDLDGTLYPKTCSLTKQIDVLANNFLIKYSGLSIDEIEKLEIKYPNILDALDYLNLSRDLYYKNVHGKLLYNDLLPDNRIKDLLSELEVQLFIVSLAPKFHIDKVLSILGLSELIKQSFPIPSEPFSNKGMCYKNIVDKYNLSVDSTWVIGDNYLLDIEPALFIKFKTALISERKIENIKIFPNFLTFLKDEIKD